MTRNIQLLTGNARQLLSTASVLGLAIALVALPIATITVLPNSAAAAQQGGGQGGGGHGGGGPGGGGHGSGGQGGGSGSGGSGSSASAGGGQGAGGSGGSGQAGGAGGRGVSPASATDSEAHGNGHYLLHDLLGDEAEDSDRPEWAGRSATGATPGSRNPTPGVAKGDLYGDLYVILRDADGVPVLTDAGYVQPIDADGNPIPLDAEGEVPEEYAALLQEVDFGRLNVGRSPEAVLDSRLEEALANLNATDPGTVISVDASGRLTYVVDGELLTIDAPLENLALYLDLMDDGAIAGLTAALDPALQPMVTDGLTNADLELAASLFAAAADKTGTFTVDEIVYMNTVLGVTGVEPNVVDGVAYVDYSDFTYDRADTWGEVTTEVLVYDATTASWTAQTVNVLDAVTVPMRRQPTSRASPRRSTMPSRSSSSCMSTRCRSCRPRRFLASSHWPES